MKAQMMWLDTVAGAMLFAAFIVEAAYLFNAAEAGLSAYALGVSKAVASNASLQSVAGAFSDGNALPAYANSTGIYIARVAPATTGAPAFHAYNGSRLVVIGGSVYILRQDEVG